MQINPVFVVVEAREEAREEEDVAEVMIKEEAEEEEELPTLQVLH